MNLTNTLYFKIYILMLAKVARYIFMRNYKLMLTEYTVRMLSDDTSYTSVNVECVYNIHNKVMDTVILATDNC